MYTVVLSFFLGLLSLLYVIDMSVVLFNQSWFFCVCVIWRVWSFLEISVSLIAKPIINKYGAHTRVLLNNHGGVRLKVHLGTKHFEIQAYGIFFNIHFQWGLWRPLVFLFLLFILQLRQYAQRRWVAYQKFPLLILCSCNSIVLLSSYS